MLLAFAYIIGWYFLFCAPLLAAGLVLGFAIYLITGDADISFDIAVFICSPAALTIIIWQAAYFIFPAYADLMRTVGLFTQRAHHLTPKTAVAMVRKRRRVASEQQARFFRWLRRKS